jgi:hypothetical protein
MIRYPLLAFALLLAGCPLPADPVTFDGGSSSADTGSDVTEPGDVSEDTGLTDAFDVASDTSTSDTGGPDAVGDAALDAGCAAPERGAWMYRHPGNPLGTEVIVGDPAEEATALANLQAAEITRIYGNYGDRPVDDTATIASWNSQLDAAGIDSQLLIGDGDDIFPGCKEEMLEKVQQRLIDFNAAVAADEQFDALHLDIEPQQYKQSAAFPTTTSCGLRLPDWPYWDDLDDAGRADRYEMLRQTLSDVRDYLDNNGHAATPIYVDLAPWIDTSSNFDWAATAVSDGTDWLGQVTADVDGITFMTYERDSAAQIDSSVSGESSLATELRVSVNAKERAPLSSTITWTDLNAMWGVVDDLEATHCGERAVDLFNYRYLHE